MEFDELISSLIQHQNSAVDEFNDLYDKYTQAKLELTELREQCAFNTELVALQKTSLTSVERELEDMKKKNNMLGVKAMNAQQFEKDNARMGKEVKQLTKKVKQLQSMNMEKQKKIEGLKKKREGIGYWKTLFKHGSEVVQLYPHRLTIKQLDDSLFEGYVLLHTDNSATFVTLHLGTDNKVSMFSPLDFPDDTPERTQKLATKFLRRISSPCMDFAQQWLYRVNVDQKGKIKDKDLHECIIT